MSQIETLQLWDEGVNACDSNDWTKGLAKFTEIDKPSAVILFNIGCAKLVLQSYQDAIECFSRAVEKDNYMAVGYFQRGVGYMKCSRWADAKKDFEKCRQNFRSKNSIDYKILGLRSNLHISEVLYNLAVAESNVGEVAKCRMLLSEAVKCKEDSKYSFIDEALGKTDPSKSPLFELPKCAIFAPPRDKVRNLQKQEYITASKVVSALEPNNKETGFMGPKRIQEVKSRSAPTSPNSSRKNSPEMHTRETAKPSSHLRSSDNPPSRPAPRLPPSTQPSRPPLKDVMAKLNLRTNDVCKHSADDIFTAKTALGQDKLNKNTSGAVDMPGVAHAAGDGLSVHSSPPARPKNPPNLNSAKTHRTPASITRPMAGLSANAKPSPPSKKAPDLPNNHKKDTIRVDFECNSTRSYDVKKCTSLEEMIQIACQLFDLNQNSIDLWYLDKKGQQTPVLNNSQMQMILDALQGNQHLKLWCYGKQRFT